MTIKKLLLTCMLASAPMVGFADVVQENAIPPVAANVSPAVQPLQLDTTKLSLSSAHSLIVDLSTNTPIYSKNESIQAPIASITKLMTAMVVLDAKLPMDEILTIDEADKDRLKNTHSRMRVGTQLSRYELMRLALMSSENRAAAALGRNYPGGLSAFVRAMNAKAQTLNMAHTRFQDSTGLSSGNRSTAEDLVKMVTAAGNYPEIHQFTTTTQHTMQADTPRYQLEYHNTNVLVQNENWDIKVSKTGFTDEAGRCLVMVVKIANRPMAMVFMDAVGKRTTVGDASRVRHWVEGETGMLVAEAPRHRQGKPRLGITADSGKKASRHFTPKSSSRKPNKPIVVARATSKEDQAERSQQRAKTAEAKDKAIKPVSKETVKSSSKSAKPTVSQKSPVSAPASAVVNNKSLGKKAIAKTNGQVSKTPYN